MSEARKKVAVELLCVVVVSLVVGLSAGFIQGFIAFSGDGSIEDGVGMAVLSAILGGLAAIVLGPILYYVLLRDRITWKMGLIGILTCLLAGVCSAWSLTAVTKIGGWLSMFVTPTVAMVFAISVRISSHPRSTSKQ